MKTILIYITCLLFSLILCQSKDELMRKFAKCASNQLGKRYTTSDKRGPDVFSNSGLIWYCRAQVGLSTSSTIYVSWKRVKEPKVGAHIYGITKDTGSSVSGPCLGVVVGVNPTIVVAGDETKGILVAKQFTPDPKYLRTEYHYVDI